MPFLFSVNGKSQAGKSSFINTLSGLKLAKVGGIGRSVTTRPFSYNFMSEQFGPVTIVDNPGFYETEFSSSDEKHLLDIIDFALNVKQSELSAILYFIPINESRIDMKSVLMNISMSYGEKAFQSTILVLSKRDLVEDNTEFKKKVEVIQAELKSNKLTKNIPIVQWINQYQEVEDDIPIKKSSSQYKKQIQSMSEALKKISPYRLEQIKELKLKVQNLAEKYQQAYVQSTKKTITKQVRIQDKIETKTVRKSRVVTVPKKVWIQEKKPQEYHSSSSGGGGLQLQGAAALVGIALILIGECIKKLIEPKQKTGGYYVHTTQERLQHYNEYITQRIPQYETVKQVVYSKPPPLQDFKIKIVKENMSELQKIMKLK